MGQLLSCCIQQGIAIVSSYISQLGFNFTSDEWNAAHNSGTIVENESSLQSSAKNLENLSESSLQGKLSKAVLICCNTYTKPSYSLGVGPLNDAITVATSMKEYGCDCYYLHNPKSTEFLRWLKFFLSNTSTYLLVYYTGHGSSSADKNSDEDDGQDEYFVFDDAFVVDDILVQSLIDNKTTNAKVVLLTDCCHSGSIWDIQNGSVNGKKIPSNIISISAAQDSQTAKQTSLNGNEQGVFTFYFYKYLSTKPTASPQEMKEDLSQYFQKFEMTYVVASTTQSYLTSKIMP